jgi:hypothetical protein
MTPVLLLSLAAFGVWIYGLYDVIQPREVDSRSLSREAWVPIVFFGLAPGAIGWLILGRPMTAQSGDHDHLGEGFVDAETSEAFGERVRARAEEQRRRYAEQKQRRLEEGSAP